MPYTQNMLNNAKLAVRNNPKAVLSGIVIAALLFVAALALGHALVLVAAGALGGGIASLVLVPYFHFFTLVAIALYVAVVVYIYIWKYKTSPVFATSLLWTLILSLTLPLLWMFSQAAFYALVYSTL